jgi:hypothetical protein
MLVLEGLFPMMFRLRPGRTVDAESTLHVVQIRIR